MSHAIVGRYDAAGDQHVGRTVCGLAVGQSTFATLPPQFQGLLHGDQEFARSVCFPHFSESVNLTPVTTYCLASVVYHTAFLRDTLGPKHKLFETPLFTDLALLKTLGGKVWCGLPDATGIGMKGTGIPTNVHIMMQVVTRGGSDVQLRFGLFSKHICSWAKWLKR